MPVFVVPIVATGLTTLGVSASVAAVAAPILTGVVLAAGSILLAQALAPKPPKPDDGKFAILQSTPPRNFIYGTVRWAGYLMLLEERDGNLYHVAALCGHEVESIDGFYLNDDVVTLTGDNVDALGDGRYSENQIQIYYRLGVVPETAYAAVDAGLDEWTSNHRGDGIASLAMVADAVAGENFSKIYPYQRPQPSAVISGAKVFDPREGAHDPDDPDTWEFSKNAALCILHHQCFNEFGPQRDYDTAILPVIDEWIDAADICDENVPRDPADGGSDPRYELNGVGTTENEPKNVLVQMLAACDGWFVERGDGAVILKVGKYEAPTHILTDDDILGYEFQVDVPDEDVINRLNVTFTSPEHNYSETECDPFDNTSDQTARGYIRESTYQLLWVHNYRQARRLGKREMYRQTNRLRGRVDLRLSAIDTLYERYFEIQSTRIPRLNGMVLENRGGRISLLNGGVQIEFVEVDSSIDDWTPADDEGEAPPVPTRPDSLGAPTPTNVDVVAEVFSGDNEVRLAFTFDAPDRDNLIYELQWRVKDKNPNVVGNQPGTWNRSRHTEEPEENTTDRLTLYTERVTRGATLEAQMRAIAPGDTPSAFSTIDEVDTVIPRTATELTGTVSGLDVELIWETSSNSNLSATRIYRARTNNFDRADLVDEVASVPNTEETYTDTVDSGGKWYYWVTQVSSGGIESEEVAADPVVDVDFDTASDTLFAAYSDSPSNKRKSLLDRVIRRLKDEAIWSSLDGFYLFAGHDRQDARVNIKNPGTFDCTEGGTVTFDKNRGFTGNGSNGHLDTGFTPSTAGGVMAQNDTHLAAWARSNISGTERLAGVVAGPNITNMLPRTAGGLAQGAVNETAVTLSAAVASSIGLTAVTRLASTSSRLYKDGVQIDSDATASTGLPTSDIVFLRHVGTYSTNQIAFGSFGGSLNDTKMAALYDIVEEYLSEIGAA